MSCEFENPANLAVEELILKVSNAGVIQHVKALDPFWTQDRVLTMYERPPSGGKVLGALDTWKARMEAYLEDLKWLLTLDYHKFWSTVLYHPTCMDMVVSFLQEALPPYMEPYEHSDVRDTYGRVRRCVLVVLSRLVTNKESKTQWMSKEHLGKIIYDHYIFSIPILWDICLVYGCDNRQHCEKLVCTVFKLQPRYKTDLVAAIRFVQESFKYIIMQVNKSSDASIDPPNLPETFQGFGEIRRPKEGHGQDKISLQTLQDLIIHLMDSCLTLRVFVEVYPECIDVLKKNGFVLSIVQVYENAIPSLYELSEELGVSSNPTHRELTAYIDAIRCELIDIFKEVLAVSKNAILCNQSNIEEHVAEYFTIIMDGLSEKLFVKDYHAVYPIDEDLEMLKQAYPNLDNVKTDFILQAVYSNLDDPSKSQPSITNGHLETNQSEAEPFATEQSEPNRTNQSHDIPDNIKEDSLISEVKDILPHLGDGFILKCLKHYGFNSERVISNVLEGSLHESLRSLDQSLPIIPEDILDTKFLETGIERLNVFDGDEFDIMSRDDIDVSKVHVGKKRSKFRDLKDMLNDKSAVKQRMDIYSKYNMVSEEAGMYSDEYDDTWDAEGGAAALDDGPDDRRPLVTPRILRQHQEASESSEEEGEPEQSNQARPSNSRVDFCVNPEVLRARREANMRARGKPARPGPPPRNVDVVGKPKGHGQEKEVLVNREKKNTNKSSRGNHSRRQGAQWKRSQGMMPS